MMTTTNNTKTSLQRKHFSEKQVPLEAVSYIIGKGGCHIKSLTKKVRNGAYIEYRSNENRFVVSAYSHDSVCQLLAEIERLEKDYETNRKKYAEYRFHNRQVDHSLVTEVIQALKGFSHSSFVEYKGDNIFMLSNYSQECLTRMIEKIESFDKPVGNQSKTGLQWIFRKDFTKVWEQIEILKNTSGLPNKRAPKKYEEKEFIIQTVDDINKQIDNFLDSSASTEEIPLDDDDEFYVADCENRFILTYDNEENPFYNLSREHHNSRRISDL